MTEWWNALTPLARFFTGAAIFFSVPFLWQLGAALIGLDADEAHDGDVSAPDADHPGDADAPAPDAIATVLAFKLLSVRALLAFFVLFFWAGTLYLSRGLPVLRALGRALAWGLAGLVSVGLLLALLPRLAHTGNRNLAHAVGQEASVYLDIPPGGLGEVRALVDGTLCHLKARTRGGLALKAGARVRVTARLDPATVEVEPLP